MLFANYGEMFSYKARYPLHLNHAASDIFESSSLALEEVKYDVRRKSQLSMEREKTGVCAT